MNPHGSPTPLTLHPHLSRRGPRWANRLAIFLTLALVAAPLTYVGILMEIAAWHAAAGQDALWNGQYEQAIRKFDDALAWKPEEETYLALRSEALLELGKVDEALANARQAIEIAPLRPTIQFAYVTALVRAGKSAEAAEFYEKRLAALGDDELASYGPTLRNNMAYHLALANVDLDRALKEINAVIDPKQPNYVLLDTRAMVLYRLGRFDEALADMNATIAQAKQLQPLEEENAEANAADHRHREHLLQKVRRGMAVLYYHRALIHAGKAKASADESVKQQHDADAALDREQVRKVGFTPDDRLF
jgi:tetratricopeptide (TPR) repeat protein